VKGARPSELPIEQPTQFEFVLNLRTAKQLHIDVPASILVRADEVIE
jgi:putative ABC transport system substrate-binding protein